MGGGREREYKQHKRNGRRRSNPNLREFVIIIVVYKKNTYFMSGAVVNAWDNETCGRGQKLHWVGSVLHVPPPHISVFFIFFLRTTYLYYVVP